MSIWKLEKFVVGAGTFEYGLWDGHPSIEQVMEAADVSEAGAWRIIDNKDDEFSLYQIEIPAGLLYR